MEWFLLQCLLAVLCIVAGFVLGNRKSSPLNATARDAQEKRWDECLARLGRMEERLVKVEKRSLRRRKSRTASRAASQELLDISAGSCAIPEVPLAGAAASFAAGSTSDEAEALPIALSSDDAQELSSGVSEGERQPCGLSTSTADTGSSDVDGIPREPALASDTSPKSILSSPGESPISSPVSTPMRKLGKEPGDAETSEETSKEAKKELNESDQETGNEKCAAAVTASDSTDSLPYVFVADEPDMGSSDSCASGSDSMGSSDEADGGYDDSPGLRRSASRTLDHDYHSSPKRTVFKSKKLLVTNKTDFDIYTAVYDKLRVKLSDCRRISKTYLVASGDTIQLPKPNTHTSRSRHLVFSRNEAHFSEESSTMTSAMFKTMPSFNLSFTDSCVVTYDESTGLKGYSMQKWKAKSKKPESKKPESHRRKRAASLRAPISRLKQSTAEASQRRHNPYRDVTATVRQGSDLCKEERAFLASRKVRVKATLESLLEETLEDDCVPTIAFAGSGGGCRAMMSTLGSLAGLEKAGLMDALTYVAGVSGSTWSIAMWHAMGGSVADLRENIIHKFCSQNMSTPGAKTLTALKGIMKQKFAFNLGSVSFIDVYGAHLCTCFFRDTEPAGANLCLSHQALHLVNATMPMPIYTAVQTAVEGHYDWWEFTPAEVGSEDYGWVPSWGFGREYKGGESVNFAPEPSLGVLLGAFGSAFCAPLGRVTVEFFETLETSDNVKGIKQMLLEKKERVTDKVNRSYLSRTKLIQPAKFSNFAHDPTQEATKQRKRKIALCDAGIDFNLPFPPLLRKERSVDIIVACNASKTPNIAEHQSLLGGAAWAREHGVPFFSGDVSTSYDQSACIFDPGEEGGPIIVYLPLRAHPDYKDGFDPQLNQKQGGYCGTFNFDYNREQIEELSGLTEFAMDVEGKPLILEAVRRVVARRRAARSPATAVDTVNKLIPDM